MGALAVLVETLLWHCLRVCSCPPLCSSAVVSEGERPMVEWSGLCKESPNYSVCRWMNECAVLGKHPILTGLSFPEKKKKKNWSGFSVFPRNGLASENCTSVNGAHTRVAKYVQMLPSPFCISFNENPLWPHTKEGGVNKSIALLLGWDLLKIGLYLKQSPRRP